MRIRLLFTAIVVACALTAGVNVLRPARASAVTGSDWSAGRIMDDGIFFNPHTMDVPTIQAFLNAKIPVCDSNGDLPYPGYANRRAYSAANGVSTPFICLKDYSQNTPTMAANAYCSGTFSGGNKSAAQIIRDVSIACSINPQVLLVLLQKEQGLVTDDWPWPIQYTKATGFSCPDTAPCDPAYAGFFYQVYYAARQFQRYAKEPNSFNYRAGQNNFISYQANNPGCGGTTVYIQNQATAGLYNYTPYQPNQAALNNLYGTGDGCSAYGNRNFWRMFSDWFGPTHGLDYSWQFAGMQFSTGSSNVMGGSQVTINVVAKNTGTQSWSSSNFPVRLATFAPSNHASALYDSSWLNNARPATVSPAIVLPGEHANFTFVANVPNISGTYFERFNLVAEGSKWFPDIDFGITLNVTQAQYKWQMVSQSSTNGFRLTPGQTSQWTLNVKNTGNVTWNHNTHPVRLATWAPSYRTSVFYDSSWPSTTRAANLQDADGLVAPGETASFVFNVRAPTTPGFYVERFNIVSEGKAWFDDPWVEFNTDVGNFYTWQMVSQSSSTGSFILAPGSTAVITLTARNTGNVTWNNSSTPARLATWAPSYRTSAFYDSSWPNQFRAATLTQATVAPGGTGTFVFTVRAPATPGFYVERFNLVAEGAKWFDDPWMEFNFRVQ